MTRSTIPRVLEPDFLSEIARIPVACESHGLRRERRVFHGIGHIVQNNVADDASAGGLIVTVKYWPKYARARFRGESAAAI